VLSIPQPHQETPPDYAGNDREWEALQQAIAKLPRHIDIPIFIGDKEIYSDHKILAISPNDKQPLATTQQVSQQDIEQAAAAALAAKQAWSRLPWQHRLAKLRDVEQLLYDRRHEICAAMAIECGYTCTDAAAEWADMMGFSHGDVCHYHALNHRKLSRQAAENTTSYLRALPGFTCAVTPFTSPVVSYHLPLLLALCGNSVVWKPSSATPLVTWIFMQCVRDAGWPPGVINLLHGPGNKIVPALLRHTQLGALHFSGQRATATTLAGMLYNTEIQRTHIPKLIAETAGNSFVVIDKDSRLADATDGVVAGAFARSGQTCGAARLVLCHKEVAAAFKATMLARLENFKIGNPLERNVEMGPVISQKAFTDICAFIQRVRQDTHCQIRWGGRGDDSHGFFFRPTYIEMDSRPPSWMYQGVYGPFVICYNYENMDEVFSVLAGMYSAFTGVIWSDDEAWLAQYLPLFTAYSDQLYINGNTTRTVTHEESFAGHVLPFISQVLVTRSHTRHFGKPGVWEWLDGKPTNS
jgi:1-pyrroline-5-carboxylate dehydrogenase